MAIPLYGYQKSAVDELKNGNVLVGSVGSGKSRTALAYYYKTQGGNLDTDGGRMNSPKDLYIITTAKKRDSMEWEFELAPFLLSTDVDRNGYENRVTVDSWNNVHKYVGISGAFFIFDEQRVVGSGLWVKSFIKIARSNEWILLSATPGDTWSDYGPVFVANGFYKNLTAFHREHTVYSRFAKYPKVDHYVEVQKLNRLRKNTLVYMKTNGAKRAIKNWKTVCVAYDRDQYMSVIRNRWDIYRGAPCRDAAAVCGVLRRIVNTDITREWAVCDLLREHPRAIIFYNFNYELDILRGIADKQNITYAEWNGQKHEPLPNGDQWLYLVQYSAGAEGWNCIETNCIIFYSQNYSYKMTTQAAGRIDRLNTPYDELYYYTLRSGSSIDSAIYKCLANKRNFNEQSFLEGR